MRMQVVVLSASDFESGGVATGRAETAVAKGQGSTTRKRQVIIIQVVDEAIGQLATPKEIDRNLAKIRRDKLLS